MELFLQDDTLITSKTDMRGKITYANEDFCFGVWGVLVYIVNFARAFAPNLCVSISPSLRLDSHTESKSEIL